MRKVVLVGLVGCWTASKPPAPQPKPVEAASVGGSTYGGSAYGGAQYGAFASLTATNLNNGFDDSNVHGRNDTGADVASATAAGLSSGFDDSNVYGRNDTGAGAGSGGLGAGPGGGGQGWGTIGQGRYRTVGQGVGYGRGKGGGGVAAPKGPTVTVDPPTAGPALDKAIIRRSIKRNIGKLQYCYEKQLVAEPKLEGTVTAEFTIGVDGLVSKSTASGIPVVDRCIADVIRGIEFPKPSGGAVVNVSYPFVFKPE